MLYYTFINFTLRYGIKCEEEIPDYLVPEMVKEQRK